MANSKSLIQADYQGQVITFSGEAWFNATTAAARFGKRPVDWLRLDETKEYIEALNSENSAEVSQGHFVKTKKGGDVNAQGTWFHPELGVAFARWLDVRFGIWCDRQIRTILTAPQSAEDWARSRHKAAATYKVMSVALEEARKEVGKGTESHHYSNEARLDNWAVFGSFAGVDRDSLHPLNLDLLAAAELRNTLLIARGYTYDLRKPLLKRFVEEERARLTPKLEAQA
jgi:hypothetical protein